MVKIAIIHNIVTPYRLELFERLSKHKYIDELNVFYCLERYNDRNWSLKYNAEYKYKILPGYTFNFPIIKLPCSINPSIFNEIRNNNYDAVIICGFTDVTTQLSYLSCKINHIPIILWSELSGVYLFKHHTFYNPLITFFIKNSDALVVPSTQSKEYHIKMGSSSNKIFISPNTNDEQKYICKIKKYKENSSLIHEELSVTTTKNIIFVGRFIKRKCVDYLLKSFIEVKAEMDNLGLILIGDGPEKENLQALCKDSGVKDVYFTGFVSEEVKIKYYSISNLFVLPSLWDIHPLVIPEAMACSLPIVSTTGVASSRDVIIDGENGYIINTKDVEQLTSAIRKSFLLNNIILMGEKSLQILKEKCSLDIAVEGIINTIKYVKSK
ncbi:MAG TPA: glycosyltransferase [Gallicola sp.]|jgi:glycosyltransferase involved in cell wall biosynthesis|nr:glycosyltransferase [Gallicola sp.]